MNLFRKWLCKKFPWAMYIFMQVIWLLIHVYKDLHWKKAETGALSVYSTQCILAVSSLKTWANHPPCKSARKDASVSSFPLSTWSSLLITSDQVAVSTNNMTPRWINTMSQHNLFSVTWIWFSFVGQHSTQVFVTLNVLQTTSTNSCLLWLFFFPTQTKSKLSQTSTARSISPVTATVYRGWGPLQSSSCTRVNF